MDTHKNCDQRNRLSAGRAKNQHSLRAQGQAEQAVAPGNIMDDKCVDRLSFAEDFMMEHSSAGLRVAVVGVKGNSRTVRIQSQPSAQNFGFPS